MVFSQVVQSIKDKKVSPQNPVEKKKKTYDLTSNNGFKTPNVERPHLSIKDDLDLVQGPEARELLLQLPLGGVEAEPEDPDAGRLGRVLPGAVVPAPAGHRTPAGENGRR